MIRHRQHRRIRPEEQRLSSSEDRQAGFQLLQRRLPVLDTHRFGPRLAARHRIAEDSAMLHPGGRAPRPDAPSGGADWRRRNWRAGWPSHAPHDAAAAPPDQPRPGPHPPQCRSLTVAQSPRDGTLRALTSLGADSQAGVLHLTQPASAWAPTQTPRSVPPQGFSDPCAKCPSPRVSASCCCRRPGLADRTGRPAHVKQPGLACHRPPRVTCST